MQSVKKLIPFTFILLHLSGSFQAEEPPGGYYRSRYDHINVDTVVNSKRLVNYYAACLLSKGPCPPQGAELKRVLPEALQTNCARCTEKQKAGAYRTIKRLRKEYPGIWKALVEEYDPTEKYVRRFEETMLSKKSYLPGSPVKFTTPKPTPEVTNNDPPNDFPPILNKFPVLENDSPSVSSSSSKPPTTSTPPQTTPSPSETSTLASATEKHTTKLTAPPTTPRYTSTTKKRTTSIFDPLPPLLPGMFLNPPRGVTTNTVSLLPGVRLQVDTPNWLSSIGNRLLRTGSTIGKAVISTVQAVVGG